MAISSQAGLASLRGGMFPRPDICAHGHSGSRISACEREAVDGEFCAVHGGPDPDAEFEAYRERLFDAADDYRKYGREGL